ncbi:MAG: cell division protein FtsQ/DivIB [Lentihominibacter sp.]
MVNENRTVRTVRKKKRRKKRYILKICLIILVCIGLYYVTHIDYFSITGIAVIGNKEISDVEIRELSGLHTGESLFDVHPFFVQKKIKNNLYIADVNVDRKLPNEVEIIVTERSGKAQVAYGKKYAVTDNDGTVLEVADKVRKVTLIKGIEAEEAEPGKKIKVSDEDTWNRNMKIVRVMEENDLYFKKIKIEGEDVKAYIYDKLVCKGKYDDVIENIENDALKLVVYDLYQKGIEKGVINIGSNNYCSFTP